MAMMAAATAGTAYLLRDVINHVFVARETSALWGIAGAVFAVFSIRGLAGYGSEVFLGRAGNRIVADYQSKIVAHILRQNMGFFDTATSSDLINRMTVNAQSVRDFINLVALSYGRDLMTLLSLVAMLFTLDPWLALGSLWIFPFAFFGVSRLNAQIRALTRKEFGAYNVLITGTREMVQGAQTIKTYGLEEQRRREMNIAIKAVSDRVNKMRAISSAATPVMEILAGAAVAGLILYAGSGVIGGLRDAGSFFAFIAALLLSYDPAKRVARTQVQLASTTIGIEILLELLRTNAPEDDLEGGRNVIEKGAIAFDNVSFSYDGQRPVLENVSLSLPAGSFSALVGPSGSGKTTLSRLIMRLYEPDAGTIRIDGCDIKTMRRADLRASIAVVSQEVFLFDGSVRANIALAQPGVSDVDIMRAAKAAHAHDFIEALPLGYDTLVGEGGVALSGGQRQRLSIARAFLRDTKIILLDEATSALDAHIEYEIRSSLDALAMGRTILIIAHRLSTVSRADRIFVMENGCIIDSGPHIELMQRDGHYRQAVALQLVR
jgi:ATP-binding cassette subfamily B protein